MDNTQEQIILEDLKEYLRKRGIRVELFHFEPQNPTKENKEQWFITSFSGYDFAIFDGWIALALTKEPIVSLADPEYIEKFCKYLGGPNSMP